MLDWHPREHLPATFDCQIILAFEVYGSEHHPQKPKEFLRWEFEIIEVQNFNDTHELEIGWPATEASMWAYIPLPPKEESR